MEVGDGTTTSQWGVQQPVDCENVDVMRIWCRSLHSAIQVQRTLPPCALASMAMEASAALLPNVYTVLRPTGSDVGVEWLLEDGDSHGLDATANVQSEAADWQKLFA